VSRIKRYHLRSFDDRIQPPPPTDDLDLALAATATYPVDVWDTQYERFIQPIEDDLQYRELLYRLYAKRAKLKPRWGNIALACFIVITLGYCTYVITR